MLGTRGQSKYQISSAVLKDNQLPDDENFQKFTVAMLYGDTQVFPVLSIAP
jgi:hypothetical protein